MVVILWSDHLERALFSSSTSAFAVIAGAFCLAHFISNVSIRKLGTAVNIVSEPLIRWLTHLAYPFVAKNKIQSAYSKAEGESIRVYSPDSWVTLISKPQLIQDVVNARSDQLSFHAVAKDMFKPEHTMNKFNWYDQRGLEGIGFVRTVRTLLKNHLPRLSAGTRGIIERVLAKEVGIECDVNVMALSRKLLTQAGGYAFFGKDTDPAFMEAAYYYNEDVMTGSEILRMTPKALVPVVGAIMPFFLHRQRTFHSGLVKMIENRLNELSTSERRKDVVQWIIDTSPKTNSWTPVRMAYEIMALWFGVGQGLTMTLAFALYNLGDHPEYIDPLREEMLSSYGTDFLVKGEGLPLMDSFIKESSRWTPVEFVTTRRCALKDFTFSDGSHIQKGEWLGIPIGSMFRDQTYYPNPDLFDGFRFADPNLVNRAASIQPEGPSNFTDCSSTWSIWGTGKMSCPGRFFVGYIMKHTIGYILENYDLEMIHKNRRHTVDWRTFTLPRPGETIRLTKRS